MTKNEIYETEITGMTTEGSGVCRIDGMAVFVPMTAIGDTLKVRIVKVLKSYAFGIIEELLEGSPERCTPDCPVFRQCGGVLSGMSIIRKNCIIKNNSCMMYLNESAVCIPNFPLSSHVKSVTATEIRHSIPSPILMVI